MAQSPRDGGAAAREDFAQAVVPEPTLGRGRPLRRGHTLLAARRPSRASSDSTPIHPILEPLANTVDTNHKQNTATPQRNAGLSDPRGGGRPYALSSRGAGTAWTHRRATGTWAPSHGPPRGRRSPPGRLRCVGDSRMRDSYRASGVFCSTRTLSVAFCVLGVVLCPHV